MTTRSATVLRKSDIRSKRKMRRLWRRIVIQILLRLSCYLLLVRHAESRILALVGRHGCEHLLFAVNQVGSVQSRDLKAMAVGDGVRRTGLDAVSAEDAA